MTGRLLTQLRSIGDMQELKGTARRLGKEAALTGRGVLRRGSRFRCPVCGTTASAFTHEGGSLRERQNGYCPRCNSKARHRRVWLHLQRHTSLFDRPTRLLHVAPAPGLARRLRRHPGIDWVGIDIRPREFADIADLTALTFADDSFDAVLCVHVLEHIEDDHAALAEIRRVLKPGGWAVLNFPCRLDRPTHEDPTVTTPEGRRIAFGEPDHHRFYGADVVDRIARHGLQVWVDPVTDLDPNTRIVNGLTDDEHVFHCVKPLDGPS